ncbi:MAG: hypothetical protein KI790_18355, partial [Cyclobacteriaceae bacterium]|nr:hypothetical protein [Cyclobacteriaceae bacterium HetDA_MAG_MS6]
MGYLRKTTPGSSWIVIGFLLSSFTAVLRLFKVSIDPVWFNYHDISHLFMILSALVILHGVQKNLGTANS